MFLVQRNKYVINVRDNNSSNWFISSSCRLTNTKTYIKDSPTRQHLEKGHVECMLNFIILELNSEYSTSCND